MKASDVAKRRAILRKEAHTRTFREWVNHFKVTDYEIHKDLQEVGVLCQPYRLKSWTTSNRRQWDG